MKKILLLLTITIVVFNVKAQTKSTGVVNLTTGMTAKLDLDNSTATASLTLTGPSDRWFALEFGSFANGDGMTPGNDIVYYNGTTLIDAVHNGVGSAPSMDANNWTVLSNTMAAGTRTIMATRSFNTSSTSDYAFVFGNTSIDFSYAFKNSATYNFTYHGGARNRGYAIDVPFTSTLGTDDFEQKNIVFYPNPTSSSFSIQSALEIKFINIYDTNGKKVMTFKNQKEILELSSLQNGIYYVEIIDIENKIQIKKIIKK